MNRNQRKECNERGGARTQGRKEEQEKPFSSSRLGVFALNIAVQWDSEA